MPEQQVHEEHSNIVIMYNATRWVGQGPACAALCKRHDIRNRGDACCSKFKLPVLQLSFSPSRKRMR